MYDLRTFLKVIHSSFGANITNYIELQSILFKKSQLEFKTSS